MRLITREYGIKQTRFVGECLLLYQLCAFVVTMGVVLTFGKAFLCQILTKQRPYLIKLGKVDLVMRKQTYFKV